MDFGLAFTYVFKDKDWFKKISILSLVALIPIIGSIVVYGWMMKIARRVMDHNLDSLPEMEFSDDLSRGFMGFIISLVYMLPAMLVYGLIFGVAMAGFYSGYEQTTDAVSSILSICGSLFIIAYGFLIALVLPAALTRYLEKNSLADAFNFGEVFKMVSKNPGTYLIVFLGILVIGFIVPFGLIACLIGIMWTYTYGMAVQGHLYGQAYNEVNKSTMIVDIPPAS